MGKLRRVLLGFPEKIILRNSVYSSILPVIIASEVQNMQHDNNKKRFAGKGYYIALIACLAAV